MTRRGFTGLAAAAALLALAGWIPGAAPGASAQPGGHGKGKAVGKAEQAPAEAAKAHGKAKGAAEEAAEEAAEAKGKPEGVGKPGDAGKPEGVGKPEGAGKPESPEAAAVTDKIRKEQRKHLRNLARINRAADVAKEHGKADIEQKTVMLRAKEYKRHQRVIDRLQRERRALRGEPARENLEGRAGGAPAEAGTAPKAGGPKTE